MRIGKVQQREGTAPRKKALVVGTHFDVTRQPVKRPHKYPQAMGTAFLAGAFDPERCEVLCYSELVSGPLVDEALLGWPDMIVLTGLSVCFDRYLHITAHAKTKNPNVIVVAGGPPVKILTRLSESRFDYALTGDIEQLQDAIREAWGPEYLADEMLPRMDLAYWIRSHGHVDSSRNCNFACSFCSLTGEKARYSKYTVDYLRKQLELVYQAGGRKNSIHLIDNNFYGPDRKFFNERIDVLHEYRDRGYFKFWTALLTGDFYVKEENLARAAASGCAGMFTGIESFDETSLNQYNKKQNMLLPQVELMRRSLGHGMVIFYGLFADIYNRSISDIRKEIEFITGHDEMMLPSFVTLPIPLVGTPMFNDWLRDRRFFPNSKLRDMDGSTISMEPMSPMDETVQFVREMQDLAPYRARIRKHAWAFYKRYRKTLPASRMALALAPNALLTMNFLMTGAWLGKRPERSHISSQEGLDPCYTPSFRIDARYESHFQPTMLTDARGEVSEAVAPDLFARAYAGSAAS